MEQKKEWVQPELTVIVRRKPEEGILGACKLYPTSVGDQSEHNMCAADECVSACYSLAGS